MTKIFENYNNESFSEDSIILYDKKPNNFITLKENENKKIHIDIAPVQITIKATGTSPLDAVASKNRGNPMTKQVSSMNKYTSTLINMMYNEVFESGFSTESEKFVKSLLDQDQFATMKWLNEVFISHIEEPKIIIGILHVISHFDYKKVYPNGQTIAMAGALHKSVEVKDYAVKAFENWNSVESLPILRSMDCQVEWLQYYVNELIRDLEEELH